MAGFVAKTGVAGEEPPNRFSRCLFKDCRRSCFLLLRQLLPQDSTAFAAPTFAFI
ncbi:hypothetical protein Hanom_Chr06g00525521 [Helianthus anomalus]